MFSFGDHHVRFGHDRSCRWWHRRWWARSLRCCDSSRWLLDARLEPGFLCSRPTLLRSLPRTRAPSRRRLSLRAAPLMDSLGGGPRASCPTWPACLCRRPPTTTRQPFRGGTERLSGVWRIDVAWARRWRRRESDRQKSPPTISRRVPADDRDHLVLLALPGRGIPARRFALRRELRPAQRPCQRPETFRRAAVRWRRCRRRWRKSCATDWMLASSLRCFCIGADSGSVRVAMLVSFLLLERCSAVRRARSISWPFFFRRAFLRWILAGRRVEDLSHELHAFLDPVRVGAVEVKLRAQGCSGGCARPSVSTLWSPRQGCPLGPGNFEEVSAPTRPGAPRPGSPCPAAARSGSVHGTFLQALRQRRDDSHAFPSTARFHGAVVMPPGRRRHSAAIALSAASQAFFPSGAFSSASLASAIQL